MAGQWQPRCDMLNRMRWLVLAACVAAAGCDAFRWGAWMTAMETPEKVKADCRALEGGQTLAVVVATTPAIDYQNPGVPLDLAMKLREKFVKNVKKLQVVEPLNVMTFQEANLGWRDLPPNQLADRLGASHVLKITMITFTTADPVMRDLGHGTMEAEVALYQARGITPEVWRMPPSGTMRVAYPDGPNKELNYTTVDDPGKVRVALIDRFADALAKKFYDHEVKGEVRK